MEGTNGCRELDRCLAACSGFGGSTGFESDGLIRCVAIIGSMPLAGRPAFPFIGQGKARVTVEEEKRTRGRSPSGSLGWPAGLSSMEILWAWLEARIERERSRCEKS